LHDFFLIKTVYSVK